MKYGCLFFFLLPLLLRAQSVDELVDQAGNLFEKGRLTEAATLLENGVKQNPGSARLFGALARLYMEQGDMNKAYGAASRGLAVDPNSFGLHLVRGDALSALGRLEEAVRSYDRAISLRADYGPAYRRRAAAERQMASYSVALKDYDEAIRLSPNDFESRNGRGMTNYFNGNPAAAIADYDAALSIRPNDPDVLNNRGAAYAAAHDVAKAAVDYKASIAADPRFADPHFQLALLNIESNDLNNAAVEIAAAVALDDHNAMFEALHSKILLRQGKTAEGLQAASHAVQIDPSSTDALFYQAIALNNSDRYDEAARVLQKAINSAPSDYLLRSFDAYMNRQAGNREAADAADAKADQLARAAGLSYTPLLSRDQGCVSGNCVNGTGVYVYPSGNRYSGGFHNRQLEGSGSFSFANGEKFEGSFVANRRQDGTYSYSNGASYTGTYNNEGRELNGRYVFNQVVIPVVNGVAQVPKAPQRVTNTETTAGSQSSRNAAPAGPTTTMCMDCYGSGKIHHTVYGGQYEYDKYGNRSVSFGSYETCTRCFGKGTVPLSHR